MRVSLFWRPRINSILSFRSSRTSDLLLLLLQVLLLRALTLILTNTTRANPGPQATLKFKIRSLAPDSRRLLEQGHSSSSSRPLKMALIPWPSSPDTTTIGEVLLRLSFCT